MWPEGRQNPTLHAEVSPNILMNPWVGNSERHRSSPSKEGESRRSFQLPAPLFPYKALVNGSSPQSESQCPNLGPTYPKADLI